jgi:hypothetical protein
MNRRVDLVSARNNRRIIVEAESRCETKAARLPKLIEKWARQIEFQQKN